MTREFDVCCSCLLASITLLALLATWHVFWAPFQLLGMALDLIWRPWGYPGHGLGPGLAREPHNGLDCTPAGAGALFYRDPGIQGTAQVGADLIFSALLSISQLPD